jgi:IMP dehydrogenase
LIIRGFLYFSFHIYPYTTPSTQSKGYSMHLLLRAFNLIKKAYQYIIRARSYNEISLVPRVISDLEHRTEADISVEMCGVKLEVPLIASPMPDVCNGEMANALARLGAMGIIHRFQSIKEQVIEFQKAMHYLPQYHTNEDVIGGRVGCAIGATGDYKERLHALYDTGCRIFCIDTANGANRQVEKAVEWIRKSFQLDVYIIAGNVATAEGFRYLAGLGVDAIRVGIAGGSVCITRTETGIYYPMASSVLECAEESFKLLNPPILIADGGIQMPADLAKSLALGADVAMAGGIFAGTKEAPGGVIKDKDGHLFKLYRGAASFGVQKEHTGDEPAYNEGNETLVPYKNGGVEKVIERFQAGLRSSFSYMNARNIKEFQQNSDWVII